MVVPWADASRTRLEEGPAIHPRPPWAADALMMRQALWAAMPEPPATLEEVGMAIQAHRRAIIEAQQKVLRRELTMPEYNAVYKEHLDAIHALERRAMELQTGSGEAAGHY